MMALKIHTTYGQIGIQQSSGSLNIKSHRDFAMAIRPPEIELQTGKASLRIDWSQIKYDLGLKSFWQLYRDQIQKNRETILNAIRQIAREGDLLTKIEKGNNKVIARLAKEKFKDDPFAGNVSLIPKHLPEIKVKIEYPRTDLKWAQVKVFKDKIYPDIEGRRGQVDVYLAQPGGVEVRYTGQMVNKMA